MTKKIRSNINGNLEIIDFVRMIHTGSLENYMRKFKLTTEKCPPYKLIPSDTQCTYCISCQQACIDQVKELKDCYKVGKDKFLKSELEEELDE